MVEKTKYTVIEKNKVFEIRQYPKLILATVEGYDDNKAFGFLFNYINGENKIREKIRMTIPVINSERIDMTKPIISKNNYFAFVMPSKYNKKSIPTPLNTKVDIKFETEKKLAVIRFSGYASDKKISKFKERLFSELKSRNVKIIGEPIVMRYNSPYAPYFIRRNEIGVEIDYE